MVKIIDSHIHLFDLEGGDYQWLKPSNPPFWPDKAAIARSFNEDDLAPSQPMTLAGYVHIEAGYDNSQFWREVAWLEAQAKMPFRVVAGANLSLPPSEFSSQIDKLEEFSSVVGVRHILDDEAESLLMDSTVQTNIGYLVEKDLSFDLQMPFTNSQAVENLTNILKEQPHWRVVINHAGFPPIGCDSEEKNWLEWERNIATIAAFPNVAIKCSGWEMADRDYSIDWADKVIKTCLDSFGTRRVMLASNFPLCIFSQPYSNFWHTLSQKVTDNKKALLHDNAFDWYRF